MSGDKIVKSTCELCNAGCGVLVHMKDGEPVKVDGDPDNPINKGAICIKGKASIEILNHPDRLKHPLKRVGERGEGKWQRITWDEALDTVATNLTKTKEKYGAESVVFMRGYFKGYQENHIYRLANVFGSPNLAAMSYVCHVARANASATTYGYMGLPDYEFTPECIVMWAVNTAESCAIDFRRSVMALDKGSKLIVIDPYETGFAKRANIWVRPRPSSDLALALGIINVIISEGLFDKDFVEKWTVGFDKLKVHVQEYSPEKVAEITWVPADTIREVASLYAKSKPACIAWGNGIDNNINNYQSARAIAILRAITGNIGRPGGDVQWLNPGTVLKTGPPDLVQLNALPADVRARRVSASGGYLPNFAHVPPPHAVKAMLTSKPYPIRAAVVHGAGLLHTLSNSQEVYRALKSLDFLVVSDFFLMPTAQLADIVLPSAMYLEINSLHESEYVIMASVIQKVAQVGECWSDCRIYSELAKRLGLGKYFWETDEEFLDYILKPAGLTFDEFRKMGVLPGRKLYRSHEQNGFSTPSGKVELFSSWLDEHGFDPLPVYHEPPESPYSEPELAKEYPLVFTNRKHAPFQHSQGRQVKMLRDSHPEPLATINTETGGKLGINEGDWVYIETRRGKIKQKATLSSSIDPRVVILDYGWWFPEKKDSELNAWAESNLNILTDNGEPYGRELGTATLRGILCKVYRAN